EDWVQVPAVIAHDLKVRVLADPVFRRLACQASKRVAAGRHHASGLVMKFDWKVRMASSVFGVNTPSGPSAAALSHKPHQPSISLTVFTSSGLLAHFRFGSP